MCVETSEAEQVHAEPAEADGQAAQRVGSVGSRRGVKQASLHRRSDQGVGENDEEKRRRQSERGHGADAEGEVVPECRGVRRGHRAR